LEEEPDSERLAGNGAKLFVMAAHLLGGPTEPIEAAGRLYALETLRRRRLAATPEPTDELHQLAQHRFPRRLRPLTALARLAARDVEQAPALEPEATPGRAAALLLHRLFGKVV
jgi:phytoene synthase